MQMFNSNPMGLPTYRSNTGLKIIYFIVSWAFAIYFFNYSLNFFTVPESLSGIEPWLVFVGGILIVIGWINFLRASKKF